MLNPCEEEEIFFDTEDHLADEEEEITGSCLGHDIWLSEPQSITVRRKIFLSSTGLIDQFEPHEVESTEDESSCSESLNGSIYGSLLCERIESNSEANFSVDYSYQEWLDDMKITDTEMETNENVEKKPENKLDMRRKQNNAVNLWKQITQGLKKKRRDVNSVKETKSSGTMKCMKVERNGKRHTELTCLHSGEELKAHNGLIWTIKFSPDGKFLASGGEDGVICVWRVRSKDASSIFGNGDEEKESASTKIKYNFHIDEEPVHRFEGHVSDVLDLAWSSSNHLLSSSTDKTVRLWKVGSDRCLRVFQHVSYVTCVQFNPVDEDYFISGSVDGKVRIWGIRTGRVEDWANVRDIVTALCFRPNGKGFLVGSVSGICRFYDFSGEEDLVLNAETIIYRKKKISKKISKIQFLSSDSRRVMITSDDSRICILDGFEVVCKYKGLAKPGVQISAAKHIILSIGEDSRVYLRNNKSPRTAADHREPLPKTAMDSERFSLANWFSMDGSSRASSTWPEEKLPSLQGDCCPYGR